MAKKVIWSLDAIEDIESIAQYISKDSEFYAASFVQRIIEKSRTLDTWEYRGRIVPEIGGQYKRNFRQVISSNISY